MTQSLAVKSSNLFQRQCPLSGMLLNRAAEGAISENSAGCRASGRTEMAVIIHRYQGGSLAYNLLQFSKSKRKFVLKPA